MIDYNQIKPKVLIVLDGDPYEVLSSDIKKKNRQKPANQTKLKNLRTGAVTEKAFHQSDKVNEAEVSAKTIKYLYNKPGRPPAVGQEWWFCAADNPKDRFQLSEVVLSEKSQYLKENTEIESKVFEDEVIGITLPAKVDLKVVEAPPSIKGNTATGGNKPVTTETGAVVDTPLFIDIGDVIRVNTDTGQYTERVEKG